MKTSFQCVIILYSYGSKTATSSLKNHLTNHGIYEETINKKKGSHQNFSRPKAANRAPATMKFTFTRKIALMCALDQASFNMVNKKGFRLFCQMNNIDIDQFPNVNSERHVAQAGLSDVYEFCLVEVRKILSQAPEFAALVLDCSTDKYGQ
jgi:hypothetical protein